jgi:hypothetical protein
MSVANARNFVQNNVELEARLIRFPISFGSRYNEHADWHRTRCGLARSIWFKGG